jgi:hypothetical protein
MSGSTEIEVNQSSYRSELPPKRSDSFEETTKFITKVMPQKTFDKVCMVLAEFLGTATLLFLGCAGTVHWDGPPFALRPPLNFGLTVMMIIQIFGHISFAILNPAVTICAVVNNLFSFKVKPVLQ